MKLLVIFLAINGISMITGMHIRSSVVQGHGLAKDFAELNQLIPTDKFHAIYQKYQQDPEFNAIIKYISSKAYLYILFAQTPEITELQQWINANWGEAQVQLMAQSSSVANATGKDVKICKSQLNKYGFNQFIREYLEVFPETELNKWLDAKITEKGLLAQLWEKVQALKPLAIKIRRSHQVVTFIDDLQKMGVDVEVMQQFLIKLMRW